jgi:hypothetical protein
MNLIKITILFLFISLSWASIEVYSQDLNTYSNGNDINIRLKNLSQTSISLNNLYLRYMINVNEGAQKPNPIFNNLVLPGNPYEGVLEYCGSDGQRSIYAVKLKFSNVSIAAGGEFPSSNKLLNFKFYGVDSDQSPSHPSSGSTLAKNEYINIRNANGDFITGQVSFRESSCREMSAVNSKGDLGSSWISTGSNPDVNVMFRDGVGPQFLYQTNIRTRLKNNSNKSVVIKKGSYYRYYFQVTENVYVRNELIKTPVVHDYWSPATKTLLTRCDGDKWNIKYIFTRDVTLNPGEIQNTSAESNVDLRLDHASWPAYVKENDYSYIPSGVEKINKHIVLFDENDNQISGDLSYSCDDEEVAIGDIELRNRDEEAGEAINKYDSRSRLYILMENKGSNPTDIGYLRYFYASDNLSYVTNDQYNALVISEGAFARYDNKTKHLDVTKETCGSFQSYKIELDKLDDLPNGNGYRINPGDISDEFLLILDFYKPNSWPATTPQNPAPRPESGYVSVRNQISLSNDYSYPSNYTDISEVRDNFLVNNKIAIYSPTGVLIGGSVPSGLNCSNETTDVNICKSVTMVYDPSRGTVNQTVFSQVDDFGITHPIEAFPNNGYVFNGWKVNRKIGEFGNSNASSTSYNGQCGSEIEPVFVLDLGHSDDPIDPANKIEDCDVLNEVNPIVERIKINNDDQNLYFLIEFERPVDFESQQHLYIDNISLQGSGQNGYDFRYTIENNRSQNLISERMSITKSQYINTASDNRWKFNSTTYPQNSILQPQYALNIQEETIFGVTKPEGSWIEIKIPYSNSSKIRWWFDGSGGDIGSKNSPNEYIVKQSSTSKFSIDGNMCDWNNTCLGYRNCGVATWVPGQVYNAGERVSYNDRDWKAKHWVVSEPGLNEGWLDLGICGFPSSSSMQSSIIGSSSSTNGSSSVPLSSSSISSSSIAGNCGFDLWVAGRPYVRGKRVSYNDKKWKAKNWVNNRPGLSQDWIYLGKCSASPSSSSMQSSSIGSSSSMNSSSSVPLSSSSISSSSIAGNCGFDSWVAGRAYGRGKRVSYNDKKWKAKKWVKKKTWFIARLDLSGKMWCIKYR